VYQSTHLSVRLPVTGIKNFNIDIKSVFMGPHLKPVQSRRDHNWASGMQSVPGNTQPTNQTT
jgi:hypothetical protein